MIRYLRCNRIQFSKSSETWQYIVNRVPIVKEKVECHLE